MKSSNRMEKVVKKEKVLVALSGGVDSAMAVYFLKRRGYEVRAVYFSMLNKTREVKQIKQVKKISQKLKVPLTVKSLKREFKEKVIAKFIKQYKRGITPNPCVFCNPEFKFKQLLKIADEWGIEKVATGHYAKIKKISGEYQLMKGSDLKKDQSYFLYRLKEGQLKRIIFPLGKEKKYLLKKQAEKLQLPINKTESQDVCFLKQQESINQFLLRHIGKNPNKIVDENGFEQGNHQGSFLFTLGQRKGLKINGGPFFVVGKYKNKVIVSRDKNHPALFKQEVFIQQVVWHILSPKKNKAYSARIRYLGKEINCYVKKIGTYWQVKFIQPIWAPMAGQSLVIYDKNKVIGGGIIKK